MKLLSLDDTEPGIVAIGGAPVGIIAIGGIPIGAIAIGNVAFGAVALSCGAGAGIVSVSIGGAFGILAGGCGGAFGFFTMCVGLGIDILHFSDKNERRPRSDARPLDDLRSGAVTQAWVYLEGPPPADVALTDVQRKRIAAAIPIESTYLTYLERRETPAGAGEAAGYRDAPPARVELVCERLETGGDAWELVPVKQINWWVAVPLTIVFIGIAVVVGNAAKNRLADLELDRRLVVTWQSKVIVSTDSALPPGTVCEVSARVRTDGKTRHKARLRLACGESIVMSASPEMGIVFVDRTVDGRRVPRVAYEDIGEEASEDSDGNRDAGRPAISLDSDAGTLRLRGVSAPFDLKVALDRTSVVVREPIRPRLD